ncbi:MAG TPA: hemolysin family protein [Gemmatimonadaceae bacterium]|nr:hemolysin family protein [Gemmatimonadaceae bacterium]
MRDVIVPTLICTLLLLLNALFVAAEFAIVGAPRPAIERRAQGGDWRARLVARVLGDPIAQDRFIATAQLGITVASLGLGMYGEHNLAAWLAARLDVLGSARWIAAHTLGSVIAVAVLTIFHLVIGEMVPKSIALQYAERTAVWVAPIMRAIQFAVLPLVVALNGLGNGVLRLFGIRRDVDHGEHYRTPEDLAYIIEEAQHGGLLRSEQAKVVAELLDFGELTAGGVMVPRVTVVGIPLGATPDVLYAMLREHPFTRYPVYELTLDRVVGMLHVKDILRCLHGGVDIERAQLREVPHVPATARMDAVMGALRSARSQMAVVMDEQGGTAGILTVEDLFEEVVGDVSGETQSRPEIERQADGTVRAAGVARLEALGDALGIELEHEEVETVSGLCLSLLGRPPRAGDEVRYADVRLRVLSVEGNGVTEALATLEGSGLAPESAAPRSGR